MSETTRLRAVIFDVEGTLVDSVPLELESWRETLAAAGHLFTPQQLQPYSGMDGEWMLEQLLPREDAETRKRLLDAQGARYRTDFLHRAMPFPDVRALFESLITAGIALAIGTTCKSDELAIYDQRLRVLDLVEHVACGDTVQHGKPDPALFSHCLRALKMSNPASAMAVGDTPYDAQAAKAAGMVAAGVLTGGFSESSLRAAGSDHVVSAVHGILRVCVSGKQYNH